MLQRIQTIYLMIIVGLLIGFIYLPIAELVSGNLQVINLDLAHSFVLKEITIVKVSLRVAQTLAWMLIVISTITIFLFKNRKKQMLLCVLSAILLVILNLVSLFFVYSIETNTGLAAHYRCTIVLPLVGLVVSFLAYRGIKKDEQLVKSYDRLR